MTTWLVNDYLTCCRGSRTFWMDLLDTFGMVDKTGTSFKKMLKKLAFDLEDPEQVMPDTIVRNASYFGPIRSKARQIAFVQDLVATKEVLESVDVVVWTTPWVQWYYQTHREPMEIPDEIVIPVGFDFDFWTPSVYNAEGPISFVGSANSAPKNWPAFAALVAAMPDREFQVAVSGRPRPYPQERLSIYRKLTSEQMREFYRRSSLLVCTSVTDPQHLTGVEAGACGVPVVASNVGIYWNREPAAWGMRYNGSLNGAVNATLDVADVLYPRIYWESQGLTLPVCMDAWRAIL